MKTLNILDLFSGSGAWVKHWRNCSYNVCIDSIDIIKKPHINYCMDVLDFISEKDYHIVYSSPPCNLYFSQLRQTNKKPITKEDIELSLKYANLSFEYGKKALWGYVIENPYTGKMKNYFPNYQIVDYSEYSFSSRKRTAIWSNFKFNLKLKKEISYNRLPLSSLTHSKSVIPDELAKYIKWAIIKRKIKELQEFKK